MIPKKVIFSSSTTSLGNMSLHRGDEKQAIKNRKQFLGKYGISCDQTVSMVMPHGNRVSIVSKTDTLKGVVDLRSGIAVDALTTNTKNIALFMVVGDCLPIAFFDGKNTAIALIHAGWKSLDSGIISETLTTMQKNFGTSRKDIIAQFGPSIGPCCYKKIENPEQKEKPLWKDFVKKDTDETYTIDIWGFAEKELLAQGLLKENIHNPKTCSYHTNNYFSHRKFVLENLENDYRFGVVLMMK